MEETVHRSVEYKPEEFLKQTPAGPAAFISIMYSAAHSHEEPADGQTFEQVLCSEIVSRSHYSRKTYLFCKVE